MADELKMVRGEGLWQDKYNRLVDTVEKMGGVVNGLQWTELTKDGLVFPSGVEFINGGYAYAKLGNRKMVLLSVLVRITSDIKGIAFPGVVTLPDMIAPKSTLINWAGGLTEFQIQGNSVMLGDTVGNANRQWNDRQYTITKLYVA